MNVTTESPSKATHVFTLDNGLKVVVREDHRSPVVASQVWYKVGSSYEAPGQTGLSHVLEHMMFKGSKTLGPDEASQILRNLGAEANAYTDADFTVYHQVLARDHLGVALELEADRMAGLRLQADVFAREIEVVKEERRLSTDDVPFAKAYELFAAMAYPTSGYHTPTIGWMADLDRMTVEDLRGWYQSWYMPNNAILVVVGDVTLDEVKTLAQRYFGPIARRNVPPAKIPLELAEPGERQLTLHVQTQFPSLILGFNVPSIVTAQDKRAVTALRLILDLLSLGLSSRIQSQLVRGEELISSGSVSYDANSRGDSLFTLTVTPNVLKNRTVAQVEAGLWRLLDELKTTPPSTTEIERVSAQIIARETFQRDSITSQAQAIGVQEGIGRSWTFMESDLLALQSVTPQDIQQAARTYFTRQRLSIGHVLPMHAKSESTSETTVPTTPEITPGDNSSPDRTLQSLAELEGKVPSSRTLDVQTWNTVEGAKVMFLAAPELPMFDLKLTFAAGSSRDGDAGGLAILTNGLLNEGVADKDAGQIADVFESVGASFKNGVENDTAVASLRSLSALDKREPVLAMFAELTGKPTFPDDAVLHIKDQVLARVNYFKQNPDAQANAELLKRVYGNHPYTTSKYGTAQSVAAITRSQIKAFHEKAYAAGNVVIALVGDLSREDAEAIAAQVSSSLPNGPALTKIEQPVQHEASTVHLEFPTKQTILRLSQLGVERDDPDYAAVVMGNWILGSGPGSRLTTEVRERRGLTYDVRSSLELLQVRGRFLIELKTRADVSEATLQLVKDVIASFLENGPTEKELAEVKRERTGRLLRSAASNASIVNKLAGIGFRNGSLSEDEDFIRQIQSLTVEQVKAAMNKHLSLDEMVIVTAGPTVPQKPLPAPIAEPAAQ